MKVNVQTPNFAADNKLIVFVEKRLSKLEQFYDRIIFADVFLKVQKTSEKQNKTVEILVETSEGEDNIKLSATVCNFKQQVDGVSFGVKFNQVNKQQVIALLYQALA